MTRELDHPNASEHIGLGLNDALRQIAEAIFGPLARRGRELAEQQTRQQAAAQRLQDDPIEWIRHQADRERQIVRRQIRRDFDRLYRDLGITRQEP